MYSYRVPDSIKDELVKEIINSITIVGHRVSWSDSSSYNRFVDLLYSILSEEYNIVEKQNRIEFSFEPKSGTLMYGSFLVDIFKELKLSNRPSFKEFCKALEKTIEQIEKRPLKRYTLVYPLNLRFDNDYTFNVNGTVFEVMPFIKFDSSFAYISQNKKRDFFARSRNVNASADDQEAEGFKGVYGERFSYFITSALARNGIFAEEYVRKRLREAAGLLMFSKHYGTIHETILGRVEKLTNLMLSKAVVFEEEEFVYTIHINDLGDHIAEEKVDENTLDNFVKARTLANLSNSEIRDVLFRAIKLYYEAFLFDDPTYSALKYWQCIEACMLKDRDLREYDMKENLKEMFDPLDQYVPTIIEILYSKRNKFVHESENFTEFDRNEAKMISEHLIEFLLQYGEDCSGAKLKKFYDYVRKTNSKLANMRSHASQDERQLIDFILKRALQSENSK